MHKLVFPSLSFTFLFIAFGLTAQDLTSARENIRKLSSREFHGRGYVAKGDKKAALFLSGSFQSYGLLHFGKTYFQPYEFNINTFPGKLEVSVNNIALRPACDYMLNPMSKGCKGTFRVIKFNKGWLEDSVQLKQFLFENHSNDFVLMDTLGWGKGHISEAVKQVISENLIKAKGFIQVQDTGLLFSARTYQREFTNFTIRRRMLPPNPATVSLTIDQKFRKHRTNNVIGYLRGEVDTFIVLTAHYDHVGQMGKDTYFPGANDNASGTAMVLDFAKTLSKKTKHHYSYAFMLFSGEEAGLLGSDYYVNHPLFPLSKIKQVLNFDMVGTGADGLAIFNGSGLPKEFALLDTINKINNFNIDMKARGPSRGSDHYSFVQKQVPALFILTNDKKAPYHVPWDTYESLSFALYEKVFRLFYQYIEAKDNGQIIYSANANR